MASVSLRVCMYIYIYIKRSRPLSLFLSLCIIPSLFLSLSLSLSMASSTWLGGKPKSMASASLGQTAPTQVISSHFNPLAARNSRHSTSSTSPRNISKFCRNITPSSIPTLRKSATRPQTVSELTGANYFWSQNQGAGHLWILRLETSQFHN